MESSSSGYRNFQIIPQKNSRKSAGKINKPYVLPFLWRAAAIDNFPLSFRPKWYCLDILKIPMSYYFQRRVPFVNYIIANTLGVPLAYVISIIFLPFKLYPKEQTTNSIWTQAC